MCASVWKLATLLETRIKTEKDYLICTSKPSYISHKIFYNNLVTIHKSKVALMLNKPAYIGMYILELSKVLMYEFHYDYIIIIQVSQNTMMIQTD